ncbi:hypothetical protein BDN70DRAFT_887451 [Pholiota conissans]|uniref:Uncharacterized protein n=1 Tax=Pholiota conissans TaxID=109636 RepID=A0A9P5YMT1_9AGAR|nr:hypothetical protein BDN70DRAFT_887451 [Pholiota conissans]
MDPSSYAVSDYERKTYYNGVAGSGEGPPLVYRTGADKYPWIEPKGEHAHQPSKAACGVFGTPLNAVWNTVAFQICDLINERKIQYSSIDVARFTTFEEDGKETVGPVVIWIGVHPGSTSAYTAHEASQEILELLEKNGVEGVEVEWRESVLQQL